MKINTNLFKVNLFAFFLLMFNYISAQKLDSLLQLAANCKGEDKLVSISNACKHAYYYEEDKSDSLTSLLQNEAKKQNNKYYLGQSYYFFGLYDFGTTDFDGAFQNYTRALKLFKSVDSLKQVAEMYHNLSMVHSNLSNIKEAKNSLQNAIRINIKLGNTKNLINNKFLEVGYVSDKEESIKLYDEIAKLSKEINYYQGLLLAHLNMGVIYSKLNNNDKHLECISKAESYLEYPGNQIYKNNVLSSKASLFYKLKKYKKAMKYYSLLIDQISKKEKKGDFTDKALKINTYYNLASANEMCGNFKKAMSFYKLYADQSDSLGLVNQAQAVASAEAKYKLDLKENENKYLKKEAEISVGQLSTAKKQRVLLGLLLFTAFVAIVLLTARYNTKQKHFMEVEKISLQIEKQNQKLNQLNIEMESILQVVSHDFRTPLAKIKMLNELLEIQEKENLSENGKEKIAKIHKSIDEAENLVSDILEIKNFYIYGEVISEPIAFSLKDEINGLIAHYNTPIELKQLKVHLNILGTETVVTEIDIFKRVLGNLLSNAVKFSEKNKEIFIEAIHKKGRITLKVKDQGPGFTEKDKNLVFNQPGKLSNQPLEWGTSHGLGLYIVDKLVREQLKGTITLNSNSQKGSVFIVDWETC